MAKLARAGQLLVRALALAFALGFCQCVVHAMAIGSGKGRGGGVLDSQSGEDAAAKLCAETAAAPPGVDIPMQDICSTCELIVKNRYMWDWQHYPESLCSGVPDHARAWCQFMSCKLRQCTEFSSGSCLVPGGATTMAVRKTNQITPCPTKYICFTCLPTLFPAQYAGCMDGLFDNI